MDAGGINVTGIASNVWTNPTRVLTVGGAAVIGATIQPIVNVTGINMATVAATTVVNYSGTGGVCMAIGWACTTTVVGGGATIQMEVTVDGGTLQAFVVISNASFPVGTKNICNSTSGSGGNAGDFISIPLFIQFNTSLLVKCNVTVGIATSGVCQATALYAHV